MIFNIYVLSSLVASRVIGYTNTTLVVFKNIYGPLSFNLISFINDFSHNASLIPSKKAIYSASVIEEATGFLFHSTPGN